MRNVKVQGVRSKPASAGLAAALTLVVVCGNGQAKTGDSPLDAAFQSMYALDFASSEAHFAEHQRLHPLDPVGYAAESACLLFSELNRLGLLEAEFYAGGSKPFAKTDLAADPRMRQQLFALTARARQIAENELQGNPNDEPALFALALGNGVLADYTAIIERHYWTSLRFGKMGSDYAQRLLRLNPNFYDAYVSTGATHYIIGALPAPWRWLVRLAGMSGDKLAGLTELRLAAAKGRYLKSYAKILLAVAYLRDNNRPAAATLVAELAAEFPTNPLFARQAKRLAAGLR